MKAVVETTETRFHRALAELGRISLRHLENLRQQADLDLPQRGTRRSSTLNNDGYPLQACFSSGARGLKVRIIADPAAGDGAPSRRLARARTAFSRWLSGRPELESCFDMALTAALPPASALPALESGALWIACDLTQSEFAAYTTARWGDPAERWPRTLDWARGLSGATALASLAERLESTEPVSVGVEGRSATELQIKIYLRLARRVPLAELDEALGHPDFAHFLSLAIGPHGIRRSGLVLSVALAANGGAILGWKVDVCAHCSPRNRRSWGDLLERLEQDFGLPTMAPISQAVTAGALQPTFLGFGRDAYGDRRINFYAEPAGLA